ncbi:MAG TPA: hypothetical protein VFL59_06905 [Candidatus Nanopelagicales bacterium]|nr:hypothetical protein [Candidatus Nanopelagicales bacterium]
MARRPASRHALPRGRAGLQAANTALQKDIAALRWSRWNDQLEMLRLESLADSLAQHVARLSGELSDVRHDLQQARTAPPARDPYIEMLAAQAAELRATVATQEALLADLTARFHALIAEVQEGRAREAAQAEQARIHAESAAAAAKAAAQSAAAAAAAPPAPAPAAAQPQPMLVDLGSGRPPVPTPPPVPELEPLFAAVGALSPMPGEAAAAPAPSQARPMASIADGVDDETVRRLRLIRESHGG